VSDQRFTPPKLKKAFNDPVRWADDRNPVEELIGQPAGVLRAAQPMISLD
jgi:hypothetical protein